MNEKGQATVEYILLFAFLMLFALNIVRAMGSGFASSIRSLGFVLSQELSTGVCQTRCFYSGYQNEVVD